MATIDDEKKRKSRSQQVEDAFNQQAATMQAAGDAAAAALAQAGEQEQADLAAANKARTDAYNEAQRIYNERMNQGYTDFANIISAENDRINKDEADAIAEREAQRRAARWSGATELAASIANLIGVGGYNAVSQQYNSPSQDWMRQAEEGWKQNRSRIDNLRDRQKALQQQLIQLRMGDAASALSNATRMADMGYQHDTAAAQQRYQTATAPVNIQLQTAEKAAAARTQGTTSGASVGLQEASLGEQIRSRQANEAMTAARYGLKKNSDGTYSVDPSADGSGSGSSGGGRSSSPSAKYLPVTFPAVGDLPTETYLIDPAALSLNVQTHMGLMSNDTRAAVRSILSGDKKPEEKAQALIPYIIDNPAFREAIKTASYGYARGGGEDNNADNPAEDNNPLNRRYGTTNPLE